MQKIYCWFCGTLRKATKTHCSYNTETGKPNYFWIYKCPNRRWYMFWHSEAISYEFYY